MNVTDAQTSIDAAIAALAQAKQALLPDVPQSQTTKVRAGENLQAALDSSAMPIEVEAGAVFQGHFTIQSNRNVIFGAGAGCVGSTGSALRIPPGTKAVTVVGGTFTTGYSDSVIQVGENTSNQTRVEDAPNMITFGGVMVPTHRGKRAFSIHGADVMLSECIAVDCYRTTQDSQAVYIGNAPGPITIRGGRYSAGSEVILAGGDAVKIPGLNPKGITITGANIFRPLSWQTDGIVRRVKNLLEIKSGFDVVFMDNTCSGNWEDTNGGQAGYAIVLTPALDGSIQNPPLESGQVGRVRIENNTFTDISSALNILGHAYQAYTPQALYGLVVKGNRFRISRAQFGGFGQFVKVGGEPNDMTFDSNLVLLDGSSFFYFYRGTVLDPITKVQRPGGNIGALTFTNSVAQLGTYGFNMDGHANASETYVRQSVTTPVFAGNTYQGPARPGYVGGTYLDAAAFEARADVTALRGV